MGVPFLVDTIAERDRLAERIRDLPVDETHQWEISITRKRDLRTNKQLRLYWRWMRLMANHTGMTPEQVDLALRRKFVPVEVVFDGEPMIIPGEVSGYDTEDYGRYLDWVHMTAWTEFAFDLPLPPKSTIKKEAKAA